MLKHSIAALESLLLDSDFETEAERDTIVEALDALRRSQRAKRRSQHDKVMNMCEKAAHALDMTCDEFMQYVYHTEEEKRDIKAIEQWLNLYRYDDDAESVDAILSALRTDCNEGLSLPDNIEATYARLHPEHYQNALDTVSDPTKIDEQKVILFCDAIAKQFNVSGATFMRRVFEIMQKRYDRENIRIWCRDNNNDCTNTEIELMLAALTQNYDSDLSTWDNIDAAYEAIHADNSYENENDTGDASSAVDDEWLGTHTGVVILRPVKIAQLRKFINGETIPECEGYAWNTAARERLADIILERLSHHPRHNYETPDGEYHAQYRALTATMKSKERWFGMLETNATVMTVGPHTTFPFFKFIELLVTTYEEAELLYLIDDIITK